jgi:CBS domain-containing protein
LDSAASRFLRHSGSKPVFFHENAPFRIFVLFARIANGLYWLLAELENVDKSQLGKRELESFRRSQMKISDTIEMVLKGKSEKSILSIAPEQSVFEAITRMADRNVGALLVLSNQRLVGILSERDYTRKGILLGHASRETQVQQIMTSPVLFVSPQHTVDECMAMMTEHHLRHLPVLQGDTVVGVISIGDLVKWVISGQAHTIQALEGYVTGAYPG